MRGRCIDAVVAAVVAVGVLTGCSTAADKSGGDSIVLQLAVIDSVDGDGRNIGQRTFVEALSDVSGGRIQVDALEVWGNGAADAESRLVQAVADGELDGGFAATRAFPAAGFSEFAAVEAPFTLTSYAAQKELVSGPAAERLLAGLEGSGIVGVGMTVGTLRRPFGVDLPLLEVTDWRGRARVFNSPVQAETVSAFGAEPAELSFGWIDAARTGSLRAVEFDVYGYLGTATTEAGNLTSNVVLWPKVNVLMLSQRAWAGLTEEQREWVSEAGRRAVAASVDGDYDESDAVAKLCAEGVRLFALTEGQREAWEQAAAPVLARLGTSPKTHKIMADIREIAAKHPADVLAVPDGCAGTEGVRYVLLTEAPSTTTSIPDGVYRVDITEAVLKQEGLSNRPGWTGTWTMTVEDGTYAISCRPIADNGKDCGNTFFGPGGADDDAVLEAGHLRGGEERVHLQYDAKLHSELSGCELPCHPLPTQVYTWAAIGDRLVLGEVPDAPATALSFTLRPWARLP